MRYEDRVNEQTPPATVRVFIALAPPDRAKDELARELRPAYRTHPDMRWNRIEDWHITLAFLGELPVGTVPLLCPPLAGLAAAAGPPLLALRGSGTFDERVLWSGIDGDLDGLHGLAADVRTAVRGCGVAFEERPLRPHLTLARARRGDRSSAGRSPRGSPRSPVSRGRPAVCTWSAATPDAAVGRSTTATSWPGPSAARTAPEIRCVRRPGRVSVVGMNVNGPGTTATARATSSPVAAV